MSVYLFLLLIFVFIFVFIYLGHVVHVADWGNPLLNVIDGWIRIYCRYFHGLIYQPISVSDSVPVLLASNHLSVLDPFLLVAACRRPIRFMMAKEEYERFGLQWLFRAAGCIPVERTGRVEVAFRASLKALNDNQVVGLFPEGGIHKKDKPPKRLKAGIVKLAKLAEVPIIPIQVDGMQHGKSLTTLLLPSHCRLVTFSDMDCRSVKCKTPSEKDCLTQLALFLQHK